MRTKVPAWRELWRAGALATAERTGAQLDALADDAPEVNLGEATAYEAAPTRLGGFGMCGRRDEYALPGTTLPYQGHRGVSRGEWRRTGTKRGGHQKKSVPRLPRPPRACSAAAGWRRPVESARQGWTVLSCSLAAYAYAYAFARPPFAPWTALRVHDRDE